jgi:abortive infection bacteriophage resistance protein
MSNKIPYSISEQISLLEKRGMMYRDKSSDYYFLSQISYYRLKGYWWDMQEDFKLHTFRTNTFFEDIIERYNFDRGLRTVLFDAIERIEIAIRTKIIYTLSMEYGSLWYLNSNLFNLTLMPNNPSVTIYQNTLSELNKEFNRSQEIFIKDQKNRFPGQDPDAWKIMEIASLGTLSKFYKILKHQLPEKSKIAQEMGLNLHNELSSWLEGITYLRNIIAHHSRLWNRNMVKIPIENINNPNLPWFKKPLLTAQKNKPFLIISSMIYLCNKIDPDYHLKSNILDLFGKYPEVPIIKIGFVNKWKEEPIWEV